MIIETGQGVVVARSFDAGGRVHIAKMYYDTLTRSSWHGRPFPFEIGAAP